MTRTRYMTLSESDQINKSGNKYPDLMSFPIDRFQYTDTEKEYILSETDLDRFYMVCYRYYGVPYYDDIVLWLNNIDSIHDVEPGRTVRLPSRRDLDRFMVKNLK